MHYDLWGTESANLLAEFEDETEAFAFVRDLLADGWSPDELSLDPPPDVNDPEASLHSSSPARPLPVAPALHSGPSAAPSAHEQKRLRRQGARKVSKTPHTTDDAAVPVRVLPGVCHSG